MSASASDEPHWDPHLGAGSSNTELDAFSEADQYCLPLDCSAHQSETKLQQTIADLQQDAYYPVRSIELFDNHMIYIRMPGGPLISLIEQDLILQLSTTFPNGLAAASTINVDGHRKLDADIAFWKDSPSIAELEHPSRDSPDPDLWIEVFFGRDPNDKNRAFAKADLLRNAEKSFEIIMISLPTVSKFKVPGLNEDDAPPELTEGRISDYSSDLNVFHWKRGSKTVQQYRVDRGNGLLKILERQSVLRLSSIVDIVAVNPHKRVVDIGQIQRLQNEQTRGRKEIETLNTESDPVKKDPELEKQKPNLECLFWFQLKQILYPNQDIRLALSQYLDREWEVTDSPPISRR